MMLVFMLIAQERTRLIAYGFMAFGQVRCNNYPRAHFESSHESCHKQTICSTLRPNHNFLPPNTITHLIRLIWCNFFSTEDSYEWIHGILPWNETSGFLLVNHAKKWDSTIGNLVFPKYLKAFREEVSVERAVLEGFNLEISWTLTSFCSFSLDSCFFFHFPARFFVFQKETDCLIIFCLPNCNLYFAFLCYYYANMLFYTGLKVTCLFSKSIHATEVFKGVAKLKIWILVSYPIDFILN